MAKNAKNVAPRVFEVEEPVATQTANESEAVASSASSKQAKASIVYLKADGSVVNFATPDCVTVRTEFANGVTRDLGVSDVNSEISHCALLQGLAIRTQRSYQAIKDIDKVIEKYDNTVDNLKNGLWLELREGAPRITMLSQAIILSLEGAGQTVDDARRQSIIEKLKDAAYREKAEENEQVKVHLATLRLEAARKREEEARDALAKKGTVADLSMFE